MVLTDCCLRPARQLLRKEVAGHHWAVGSHGEWGSLSAFVVGCGLCTHCSGFLVCLNYRSPFLLPMCPHLSHVVSELILSLHYLYTFVVSYRFCYYILCN